MKCQILVTLHSLITQPGHKNQPVSHAEHERNRELEEC